MKEREPYFDNVKFILILFVVVGHTIEPIIGGSVLLRSLYIFFYLFHIPLFVFISGYFSKNTNSDDYGKKLIGNLIIPYIIFETAYSIVDFFIFKRESLSMSYFTPYWIMWFIFSMIMWKIAIIYIKQVKFAIPLSFLLAIMVGYAGDVGYYASISRTFVFLPFFLLGFYFDKKYLKWLFRIPIKIISFIIIISVVIIIYYYGQDFGIQWLYGSISYKGLGHGEWYAGVYRIAIYAVNIILSICILALIPRRTIPIMSILGQRTIYAYLFHGFIIKYMLYKNIYKNIDTFGEKIGLIIIGLVMTIVLLLPIVRHVTKGVVAPKIDRLFH